MTERTLKWVLLGVAIVAVVYAITAGLGDGPGAGAASGEGSESFDALTALEPAEIEEATIFLEADTIHLRRAAEGVRGGWTANGFRGDSARIERLLRDLTDADYSGVVARNPENHDRLGVSADSAARVILQTTDGETREIHIGDQGPSFSSTYLRIDGGDEVHLVEENLSTTALQGGEEWRDHVVIQVDTARVGRVVARSDSVRFRLDRAAETWTLRRPESGGGDTGDDGDAGDDGDVAPSEEADGEPADAEAVGRVLGALRRLLATGFVAPNGEIPRFDRSLLVVAENGDTLADLSLDPSEGAFHVMARGDSILYQVSRFDVARLFPDPSTLAADTTGATDSTSSTEATSGP